MEPIEVIGQKLTFVAPSGASYTIREQNGADDDILSNARTAKNLMNLSYFIASIVVETDATVSKKLNAQEALKLPVLDRYCILLNSRIFSLGNILEFTHDWGKGNGGEVNYEQDLEEFLFDYAEIPSAEVLEAKPDAIPFYPNGKNTRDLTFTLSSGKGIKFDILTGEAETQLMEATLSNRTKNQELIARNLCLKVNGSWEKVQSFFAFTAREMIELRKIVYANDPVWTGSTKIVNPETGEEGMINILGIPGFFYPEEI